MGCVLSCLSNGTFMTWGDNHLTTDEFRLFLMCLKSAHHHANATNREGSTTMTKTDVKQHIQQHFYLFAGKQTTRVEALLERTCDMFLPVLTATDPKHPNAKTPKAPNAPNAKTPKAPKAPNAKTPKAPNAPNAKTPKAPKAPNTEPLKAETLESVFSVPKSCVDLTSPTNPSLSNDLALEASPVLPYTVPLAEWVCLFFSQGWKKKLAKLKFCDASRQEKLQQISILAMKHSVNLAFGYVMSLPDAYLTFLATYLFEEDQHAVMKETEGEAATPVKRPETIEGDTKKDLDAAAKIPTDNIGFTEQIMEIFWQSLGLKEYDGAETVWQQYCATHMVGVVYMMNYLFNSKHKSVPCLVRRFFNHCFVPCADAQCIVADHPTIYSNVVVGELDDI